MTHEKRLLDYHRTVKPPSDGAGARELAFYYVLGFGGLMMFLIGFFGLPMPWLMSLFA